jgi:hypothetical protein
VQIGNQRLSRKENRIRRQPHFDPGRLPRLVQCRINFCAGHPTKLQPLKKLQKLNPLDTKRRVEAFSIEAARVKTLQRFNV